jgi:hypothetical protein
MENIHNEHKPNTSYEQVNVTLDICYKSGDPQSFEQTLNWVRTCLNCNTNRVVVNLVKPTGFLGWPDFLDAPGFGPEHPDYPAAVESLKKLETWLKMDRKELIGELLAQDTSAVDKKARYDEAHSLFEKVHGEVQKAIQQGDLSGAQFPRFGHEAMIELTTRQSQMQWVLEMLPNPSEN